MSLVAYGSSGEESEEDTTPDVAVMKQTSDTPGAMSGATPQRRGPGMFASLPAPKHATSQPPGATSDVTSMFASLPAPRTTPSLQDVVEEEEEVKPRHKVKICIPALTDLKEEDAPKPKKPKPASSKGSGLLAMLPEPRNFAVRSFVPQAVRRPPPKPPAPKRPPPKAASKPAQSESDSSDDEAGYFSLTSEPVEPAHINLEELLPPTAGPSRPPLHVVRAQYTEPVHVQEQETAQSSTQDSHQLSDEAIRKLCGPRVKEEVRMIEVHGDNMLPDPKDWMLKQMTEEQEQMAHRSSQPSSAHRRKHQITYLAFQAKEREIELKNQWSANRMTKKQTQAKYGF